jgi:TRAP-type C4-dicarboxylate transport system substrate-binding protein
MAISQHVVDGCVDPWETVPALKLQDMLKFHTELGGPQALTTATFVVAMNKQAYDRLPDGAKKAIDDNSGEAAAAMAGAMWDDEAAKIGETVRRDGDSVTTLTPQEAMRWRNATEPVIAAWLKAMKARHLDGARLLETARALLAKYELEPEPARSEPPTLAPEQKPGPKPVRTPPPQAAAPSTVKRKPKPAVIDFPL